MASAQKPRAARMRDTKPPLLMPVPVAAVIAVATKRSQLIGMLKCEGGATTDELANTLGWLPHTTRAALTGLRKKGHAISKAKADDGTRYSLTAAAVA